MASGARCAAIAGAICRSGSARIFASTRSNGARARNCGAEKPVAQIDSTKFPTPFNAAFSRATIADTRIDVAGQHVSPQRLGRGDSENAGAGAEIENAPWHLAPQHLIEQQQAAARGAVMTGAERQRGLDLDAELVRRHMRAIMLAVDDETAGGDRHQAVEAGPDPVLGGDGVEDDGLRDVVAGGQRDQRADSLFIRRIGEVHRHVPAPSLRANAATAASPSSKISVRRSATRRAICSSPMAKVARLVAGVTASVIGSPALKQVRALNDIVADGNRPVRLLIKRQPT